MVIGCRWIFFVTILFIICNNDSNGCVCTFYILFIPMSMCLSPKHTRVVRNIGFSPFLIGLIQHKVAGTFNSHLNLIGSSKAHRFQFRYTYIYNSQTSLWVFCAHFPILSKSMQHRDQIHYFSCLILHQLCFFYSFVFITTFTCSYFVPSVYAFT